MNRLSFVKILLYVSFGLSAAACSMKVDISDIVEPSNNGPTAKGTFMGQTSTYSARPIDIDQSGLGYKIESSVGELGSGEGANISAASNGYELKQKASGYTIYSTIQGDIISR